MEDEGEYNIMMEDEAGWSGVGEVHTQRIMWVTQLAFITADKERHSHAPPFSLYLPLSYSTSPFFLFFLFYQKNFIFLHLIRVDGFGTHSLPQPIYQLIYSS